ncbi:MAG: hypothetical protein H0X50_09140 [Nitrosopumilus sp.]|nr:hypothetical protein [Nitrosopumilus sp.]
MAAVAGADEFDLCCSFRVFSSGQILRTQNNQQFQLFQTYASFIFFGFEIKRICQVFHIDSNKNERSKRVLIMVKDIPQHNNLFKIQ